jgi:extradiol dioxygenase family protein
MNKLISFSFSGEGFGRIRKFYGEVLGCQEGRSSNEWIDSIFSGIKSSRISRLSRRRAARNEVDADHVPSAFRHRLEMEISKPSPNGCKSKAWSSSSNEDSFRGRAGRAATMFFLDPSGNALEFKASRIFASLRQIKFSPPNTRKPRKQN